MLTTTANSLRAARADDEAFLYDLYASTRADEMALCGWSDTQRETFLRLQFTAQRWSYATQYEHAEHLIVVRDDRPIGRTLIARGPREIVLVDIALLPAYRGRGIGTELLRRLLSEAERSRKSVRLHVLQGSRAARLYARLGFRVIAVQAPYVEMEWQPRGTA